MGERVAKGLLGDISLALLLQEFLSFGHLAAHHEGEEPERPADEVADSPTPVGHEVSRRPRRQTRDQRRRKDDADARGEDSGRGDEATTPGRCLLNELHDRAAVFATCGETLQQSHGGEEQGGGDTNNGVDGEEGGERHRDGHHCDGEHECLLATQPIAETAKECSSRNAHDRAGGEDAETGDGRHDRLVGGEEEWRHDRDEIEIEAVVEPFHDGARGPIDDRRACPPVGRCGCPENRHPGTLTAMGRYCPRAALICPHEAPDGGGGRDRRCCFRCGCRHGRARAGQGDR